MSRPLIRVRALGSFCTALLVTVLSPLALKAGTDFNKWPAGQAPAGETNAPDGLDDLWQTLFNAWALSPGGDEDNDGLSNAAESISGTDPFDSRDHLRVAGMAADGAAVTLTFDVKAGKKYRVLSDDSPNGLFSTVEPLVAPSGGLFFVPATDNPALTVSLAKPGDARRFYKVEASDVDSTGGGVSDWVKRRLGLDPEKEDTNNDGLSDADEIIQELQVPDVVTILATRAFGSEDGPESGTFTVKRSRSLFPATVQFSVSGTATPGTDFNRTPVSAVSFPAGVKTAPIHVNVLTDAAVEGGESVTATLTTASSPARPPPQIGQPASATVIINDDTAPRGRGLLARYYDLSNANLFHGGNLGQIGTYSYIRTSTGTPNTGTITIPYSGTPAVEIGHVVRVTFTSGNLNAAAYNHLDYIVTDATAANFTLGISGSALPANGTGSCQFSFQTVPHPAVVERVDPTVDFDWARGAPNAMTVGTVANVVQPDNYSSVWEAFLAPAAGSYQFQLDADDKARVLLDLNRNGVFDLPAEQIIEHGWDGPAVVGTFKVSSAYALSLPANAAERYRIRVEHVETTGESRCRLQWRAGTAAFANIPQANTFTHTAAMNANYSYTRTSAAAGAMTGTITVTLNNHGLAVNDTVELAFSTGVLFTPANGNFHGAFTVANVTGANTFLVNISAPSLPAGTGSTGAGFVLNRSESPTTGWFNNMYATSDFSGAPGRIAVDASGATTNDNGIFGSGTPDPVLINPETFSARWTGQVQPQFTEDYTFVVHADDGCKLWINGEVQPLRVAISSNIGGSTYTYDGESGETVITYSGAIFQPNSFAVGETVRLDPTSGPLSALGTLDYLVTEATDSTITVNFGTGVFSSGAGNMNIDLLNKPVKDWSSNGNERYVRLPMAGGKRYDIQLDFWENTGYARCRLFWYSPSQPKQIIPAERLYPSSDAAAPAVHLSATAAVALVGGAFSHLIQSSNGGTVSVSGNPPWLTYANGILSGTPPPGSAGMYQVLITLANGAGTSTSVLNLEVQQTGGGITRELWAGVAGTAVSAIPHDSVPTSSSQLTSLESPTDAGDNYGARLRGYITAPVTGNYRFKIAASDSAELWISNDDEPVNSFRRAVVQSATGPRQWNLNTAQTSPLLALEQGRRYYIEILHKAGAGAGDNLAVGWSKPGEPDDVPSEVVPGYVLSPYVPPPPGSTPGTLYVATMLAQGDAVTNGVGTATLRLSEDENTAIVNFAYSGLTGELGDWHVHSDPFFTHPSAIIYDGTEPAHPNDGPRPDGSHHWTIEPVGTLSKADIIELIKQGKAYINLHTALYPNGEIRGNFTLAHGSRIFTAPPPPPAWTDDSDDTAAAVRFLTQATYGASVEDIQQLQAITPANGKTRYELWIEDQFTKPASPLLPEVLRTRNANAQGGAFSEDLCFNAWWWRSVAGEDQLRQRIAFALSEIHVVSAQGPLDNRAEALAFFYDRLLDNAFENFRDVLVTTTLAPAMGRYLDMLRNDKPDLTVGRIPNENYAREIKQLFSVGLYRMWPDGTLMLTSKDTPIDTYSQTEIVGFSHVFTGWDYGYDGGFRTALNAPADWMRLMRDVPARHFTGQKRVLNNEVLPGLPAIGGQPLDPYAVHSSAYFNRPEYQALPAQELAAAHDQLFNHPNTGPFICRQLIQRLVTSHPSRAYLYRVTQKFNDNGAGVRGDMKAVIKAILLDYEARSPDMVTIPAYGKQREPVLRITAAGRAFRANTFSGTYTQNGTRTITINTTTPHGFVNNNAVFLEFTPDDANPAPWTSSYSIAGVTANSFTVQATGWVNSSTASGYSIPANSTTCTVTMSNHWLQDGHKVFVDFTSGPANGVSGLDGQVYELTSATAQTGTNGTFTFEIPAGQVSTSSRTGNCMVPRFSPGSFTAGASGLPAPNERRVTMRTDQAHHLNVGDQVQINFTGGNPQPVDMVATVESVIDVKTWTFLATAAGTNLGTNQGNNSVYQFPLVSQPLVRTGTIGSRLGTFAMGNTDALIDQSPLNAQTVFNFYLPDFKFPGMLASQGITTPEFQETAETSVIRQANFLTDGLLNPNTTNGISSFRTGSNAIVLNYMRWMTGNATNVGLGPPVSTTVPWTHNQNLDRLIDHLSILLTADQLSAPAKTIIRELVARRISAITVSNPCAVTTVGDHGFATGDSVLISGVSNGTFSASLNNTTTTRTITVTGPATFTVSGVSCLTAPNSAGLANAHVSAIPYNNGGTPTDTHRRDRLRAILHLIFNSPDYTIQR